MSLSFEDYCEDYLDQCISLMSDEGRKEAYEGYISFNVKPAVTEQTLLKRRAAKTTVIELKEQVNRIVERNINTLNKFSSGLDTSKLELVIDYSNKILAKKVKKIEFFAIVEEISLQSKAVDRDLNNQRMEKA